MRIKEIRQSTGLTQRDFARLYEIPLQTLKQWEANRASSSYREPPEYVVSLLARMVAWDFVLPRKEENRQVQYIEKAAQQSRTSGKQWMRYLRKLVAMETIPLTPRELVMLMESEQLSPYQKISLRQAATAGTITNQYVQELNAPAKPRRLQHIMERHHAEK